jgi:hypothetical protein
MSGGRQRTALEETGARLGDVLRRALSDRLARRMDGFLLAAHERQGVGDSRGPGVPMLDRTEQGTSQRDGGETR